MRGEVRIDGSYELRDTVPDGERWAFLPSDVVVGRRQTFGDAGEGRVAYQAL